MINREKVIAGLEHCLEGPIGCQKECPYKCDFGCRSMLARDALELIKAQEPVKVQYEGYGCYCANCNARLAGLTNNGAVWLDGDETPVYCWKCGKELDWDELA